MTAATQTREETLHEIALLEDRLAELRASLPSCLKSIFRFRCRPQKFVWIYAIDREEAERKLHERMNLQYGDAWSMANRAVDVFRCPEIAANNASCSLLSLFTPNDAREFVKDWHASQQGKTPDPNRPKHLPKSQLENDIECFERDEQRRNQ